MKKKRKPFDKQAGWAKIGSALVSHKVGTGNGRSAADLSLNTYTALDALANGRMDHDKFYCLVVANAAGYLLAMRVHDAGTESAKAAMKSYKPSFDAAADALNGVGERYAQTGRFGANGEQLQQIRAATAILDQLSQAAPIGMLYSALVDADEMAGQSFNAAEKVRRAA